MSKSKSKSKPRPKSHTLVAPGNMDRVIFKRIGRGYSFWVIVEQREFHEWFVHTKKKRSNRSANTFYMALEAAGWKLK